MKIFDRDAIILLVGILFFIAFVVFMLICPLTIVVMLWTQGGQFVNQPSGDILATAEYLYDNPLPTPHQIIQINVNPSRVNVLTDSSVDGEHIFTRWFLNGERVPRNRHGIHLYDYSPNPYYLELYGVSPGLHLVEIQINLSPFYTAMSYQWAIKIEAPPPTVAP